MEQPPLMCPKHPEEGLLREEYGPDGRTGFCLKCLQHYKLCNACLYTGICQDLLDHPGEHVDRRGFRW